MNRIEIYIRRTRFLSVEKTYGWRLKASNGEIIATDGGQGYVHSGDAIEMARRIVSGKFNDAVVYYNP